VQQNGIIVFDFSFGAGINLWSRPQFIVPAACGAVMLRFNGVANLAVSVEERGSWLLQWKWFFSLYVMCYCTMRWHSTKRYRTCQHSDCVHGKGLLVRLKVKISSVRHEVFNSQPALWCAWNLHGGHQEWEAHGLTEVFRRRWYMLN